MVLEYLQSGEISPNLVTLLPASNESTLFQHSIVTLQIYLFVTLAPYKLKIVILLVEMWQPQPLFCSGQTILPKLIKTSAGFEL